MSKYTAHDVERIAEGLRRQRAGNRSSFNLLTGAGCSLSAGIPLAADPDLELVRAKPWFKKLLN